MNISTTTLHAFAPHGLAPLTAGGVPAQRTGSGPVRRQPRLCGPITGDESIQEVINMLSVSGWAGELEVLAPAATFRLGFAHGALKSASSSLQAHRLGELLLQLGRVRREDLYACLHRQDPEKRIGEMLLQRELLTKELLFDTLRIQAERIFYAALTVARGAFVFRDFDETSEPPPVAFHVPIQHLLLEGARRRDEGVADGGYVVQEAKYLLRAFNGVLRTIFASVPSGSECEFHACMRDYIEACAMAPHFGHGLQPDGTVAEGYALCALQRVGEWRVLPGLYQSLHDLTAFACFAVGPMLTREAERHLASAVMRRLLRIETPTAPTRLGQV